MSLTSAQKRLHDARVSLDGAWRSAEARWRDAAAARFHSEHIEQIEPTIHAAINGMQRMAEILERARSECQ